MNAVVSINNNESSELIGKTVLDKRSDKIMDRILSLSESGANSDIINTLVSLYDKHKKDESRMSFEIAMSEAMAEIPEIYKGNEVKFGNTNYKYEDLASITKIIRPILSKYGLSSRFRTNQNDKQVSVTCIISHKDGYFEENTLSAANDTSGNKNGIQAIGSAVTYLERYTIKAALGLAASNDDDGNSFENNNKKQTYEKISSEKLNEIMNFINEYEINLDGFCKHFKIKSVNDLPSNLYETAMKAIEKSIQLKMINNEKNKNENKS